MGLFKNLFDVACVVTGPVGWFIGSQVDEEINKAHSEGHREGHKEGFKNGVRKGEAEANRRIAEMNRRN